MVKLNYFFFNKITKKYRYIIFNLGENIMLRLVNAGISQGIKYY
jgi:hypothetical protein